MDPSARWVWVAFEVSPSDLPAQRDTTYTDRLPARLEPGTAEGEIRVIVDAALVEQRLIDDQNPVPGSFSDFVWTFDVQTGHVLSATLTGEVLREIRWGFVKARASAAIAVEMATAQSAGFRDMTRLMGQTFFRYCTSQDSSDCTIVDTQSYDTETGYVNAVGRMQVQSSFLEFDNFSPLGEAIFSEYSAPAESIGEGSVAAMRPSHGRDTDSVAIQ
jgi:hypothetical protein